MADIFTQVTVSGLYDNTNEAALFGATGTAVPASALFIGGSDGTNVRAISVDTTGRVNVNASITPPTDNVSTGSITTTQNVAVSTQGTSALMVQIEGTWTGTVVFEVTLDGTNWQSALLYPVFPDGAPAVSSATANGNWTLPVGGVQQARVRGNTVATGSATIFLTAGQGQYSVIAVNPVFANLNATVVGNKTNNNAASNGTNVATLPAVATTAAPTYTTGNVVALSTDLAGSLRVSQQGTVTVTGTVSATQGTSPWVENLTQVAGVALGATAVTNFGTAPAATPVPGTNSSIYAGTTGLTATGSSLNSNITNTVTVTGTVAVTQSTSPWVVAGNLTHNNAAPAANNVGVLPAVASTAAPTYTTGDQVLLSTDLAGNLRTTATFSGTVTVAGNLTNNNAAPAATNVGVLPALAETAYTTVTYTTGNQVLPVTDLHGAMNSDLQAWHNTELGNPTNFGTTPGAVIVGQVNASIFQGTAAIAVANTLFTQISDGAAAMGTMANFGTSPGAVKALNTNSSIYAGTTGITATGSSLNVNVTNTVTVAGGLTDNNAAPAANNVGVLPALIEAGTFPAVTLPAVNAGDQALVSVTQGRSLRIISSLDDNQANVSYYSVDSGITQKSLATATITPLFSIQSNSAAFKFTVTTVQGFTDGSLNWFALVKNPQTLTGAAFTTTGIPTGSHIKIDTTATAITIGTGSIVWSGYSSSNVLINDKLLMALAAGTPGDTYTIVAEKFGSGTAKVTGVIGWRELAASI